MTLRHVQRGQPLQIPADDWNRIVDATRAHYEGIGDRRGNPATAGSKQASVILIRNATGADQPRFAVLGIDTPIILPGDNLDEFQRQVALSCVTPTIADHAQRFVILLEPIRSGGIGRAVIAGVAICKVAIVSAGDTTAGIVDSNSTHLVSGQPGAQILWPAGTAGGAVDWAVVRLGGESISPGRLLVRITGASTIAANRWGYSAVEVVPEKLGRYKDKVGGWLGTAYNTVEANNAATGIQGSGDDMTDWPSGVNLQPIGVGAVVDAWRLINCEDNEEIHFCVPNNPGGQCVGGAL